jgi:hypothetical protein
MLLPKSDGILVQRLLNAHQILLKIFKWDKKKIPHDILKDQIGDQRGGGEWELKIRFEKPKRKVPITPNTSRTKSISTA